MDYQRIYNNLIAHGKNRLLIGYFEEHHIIPKCFFKSEGGHFDGDKDELSNLVNLTPEEHYLAHQLLVKIYPKNHKLIKAVRMMSVGSKTNQRYNNKLYGWIKRLYSEIGIAEETKQKISKKLKGNKPWNTGLTKETSESLRKISEKFKGKTSYNKGLVNKNRNKSFKEIYGEEKAKEIGLKISKNLTGKTTIRKNAPSRLSKSVICLELNKVFPSVSAASRFANLKSFYDIHDVCAGKKKTAGGYHWKFIENHKA